MSPTETERKISIYIYYLEEQQCTSVGPCKSATLSKFFPKEVYIIHANNNSNIYNKSQYLFNIYVLGTFIECFMH